MNARSLWRTYLAGYLGEHVSAEVFLQGSRVRCEGKLLLLGEKEFRVATVDGEKSFPLHLIVRFDTTRPSDSRGLLPDLDLRPEDDTEEEPEEEEKRESVVSPEEMARTIDLSDPTTFVEEEEQ